MSLKVRGDFPDLEPVKRYFEDNFPDAVLKVDQCNQYVALADLSSFGFNLTLQRKPFAMRFCLVFCGMQMTWHRLIAAIFWDWC